MLGLIAAGIYPNPVGIADFVASTTHKTLRGPRGGFVLAAAQHEKALNSIVFPGLQGGAVDACHRCQSGGIQGGPSAGVQDLSAPTAVRLSAEGGVDRLFVAKG
jgi:hypothetical protein